MTENLLGVKIDYITIEQAIETVQNWLKKRGKHIIVTPNPEMLVDSKFDNEFKSALYESDMSIPDSPRLGWASKLRKSGNPFFRLIYLPSVLFPNLFSGNKYPTTTGTDLMEHLIRLSQEKAYTTAYLGGSKRVAVRLEKCLRAKYPNLKFVFCSGNIKVDEDGNSKFEIASPRSSLAEARLRASKGIKLDDRGTTEFNAHTLTQKIDILFVAFGHKKQEKWMYKNLPKLKARIMVGVGGAFDYLSGSVPRAPKFLRSLGLEWVFRVSLQPWRIKRLWKLPYFVYMVMTSK